MEQSIISSLWELCNAEHSHICQVGVPLLLHCITLPLGSDVFWRVVQEAFHDTDWRVRFTAVERVTVITRFMDSTPLRSEVGLQTALATAFCHLIASMDDINVYVAQRATLYIGTIHDTAIRSLLFCLESQFDLFIVDRPVVLQSVYQLHNSLSDRKMLGWEFFLNRFDTLFVEAQINLEKCGDISYLRDLRNSDNGSEALSAKIQKAREALSQSDTSGGMAKTLSASFGTKWPYKRTMSAPASMAPRQDSKFGEFSINRSITSLLILPSKQFPRRRRSTAARSQRLYSSGRPRALDWVSSWAVVVGGLLAAASPLTRPQRQRALRDPSRRLVPSTSQRTRPFPITPTTTIHMATIRTLTPIHTIIRIIMPVVVHT